jgi:hypothetical protein
MDKNTKDILEAVNFIKERMLTKDDVREIVREETKPQFDALKMKIDGIQQSLDTERTHRTDLKIPRRLHDVEEHVYGTGGSKHPKHLPLA